MNQINPTQLMIRYEISTTGYFFSLKWDEDVLVLNQFSKNPFRDEQVKIVPTNEQWADFWDTVSEMNIWNWYEEYPVKCADSCVKGDEWEVNIEWDDEMIESYGSNSYPSTFQEFLKAVEELTGIIIEFIHLDS